MDLGSLHGTGPGGRIVKADVEGAADEGIRRPRRAPPEQEPARRRQPPSPRRHRRRSAAPAKGDVVDPGAVAAAGRHRPPHGGVQGDDPRLRHPHRRRHGGAASRCGGRSRSASADATVPSYNDMVVKACALALREFPRANGAYRDGKFELYSARERRRRRRRPGRAGRADRLRRRQAARSARSRGRRARSPATCATARSAARAQRRHVHGVEPRHVRRDPLHRRHQPAAGRDPRGRSDRRGPVVRRRRGRRAPPHGALARPATTASSTAPTPREFLARIRELPRGPLALVL